jgi:hypothetical protein
MQTKVKVKLVDRSSDATEEARFKKQSPRNEAKWGSCLFKFNALEQDYDWLVVLDDVPKVVPNQVETLACPKKNTILVTTEPSSIAKYGKRFARQFNYIITNQDEKALPHPNATRSQTGQLWYYGKSYDEIVAVKEPTKTKKLSTVCSDKRQGHTLHKLRYDFTALMEEKIPKIERFGHGIRWIDTKAEAIDDYEFHVAIENQYAPHVWTEKLADTYLGFAVPIYYGCPNIAEYFPEDSYILIDIYDVEGSLEKIKQIISTPGEYERRLPAIKEARRRVIEEYNLLAMIDKIVTEHQNDPKSAVDPEKNKIYNRRKMRTMHLSDLFSFLGWKLKISVQNMLSKLA